MAPRPRVTETETDPQNRRAYMRLPANIQVQLEPERADRQHVAVVTLNGTTTNISSGGMLAKVEQGILRHSRYLIRFLDSNGALEPSVTCGAVRRCLAGNRVWEVGIEFDDPLEILK